jgi:hypothetical protein
MGCELAQGFLYGHPGSGEQLWRMSGERARTAAAMSQ